MSRKKYIDELGSYYQKDGVGRFVLSKEETERKKKGVFRYYTAYILCLGKLFLE